MSAITTTKTLYGVGTNWTVKCSGCDEEHKCDNWKDAGAKLLCVDVKKNEYIYYCRHNAECRATAADVFWASDDEDDDVCCVGCGERVCSFHEEPPHKDRKGEAVCDGCSVHL